MLLHEQIKGEVKQAMLEKNQVKLSVVRGLLAAFTNELITLKHKPDEKLADEDALKVIRREAKKRKDSIEQFTTAGRSDLVESEVAELAYVETYLPALMNHEEIKKVVEAKMAELSVSSKSEIGKLLGAVMRDLAGKADGTEVKAVAEELLA